MDGRRKRAESESVRDVHDHIGRMRDNDRAPTPRRGALNLKWGGGRPRPPSRGVEPRLLIAADRAARRSTRRAWRPRSEEHTSALQSPMELVCRLLLEQVL